MAPLALWLRLAASAADMWSVRIYDMTSRPDVGWPCYGGVQGRWAAAEMGACVPPPVKGWPSLRIDECSGTTKPLGAGWMRGSFFRDDACTEPLNGTQSHYHPWHIQDRPGGVSFGFKNPDLSTGYDPMGCEHYQPDSRDRYHWHGGDSRAFYGCKQVYPDQVNGTLPDGAGRYPPGVNVSQGVNYIAECYTKDPVPQPTGSCGPDCRYPALPAEMPPPPEPVPPAPTGSIKACVGKSVNLTSSECAAWQKVFDGMGGADWRGCNDSRQDPCGCKYSNGTLDTHIEVSCSHDGAHVIGLDWVDNYKDNSHNVRVDNCSAQVGKDACLAYSPPDGLDEKPRCWWSPRLRACRACSVQNQQEDMPPALAEFPLLAGIQIANTAGAGGRFPSEGFAKLEHFISIDTDSSGIYGPAPEFNYSNIVGCEMMLGQCPLPPGAEHCCQSGIMGLGCGCSCDSCGVGMSTCALNETSMRITCHPDPPTPITPGKDCCKEGAKSPKEASREFICNHTHNPAPAPPPQPPPPSPAPIPGWEYHHGLNCYQSHGATDLESPVGSPCGVLTLAECAQKCSTTPGCSAFVFDQGEGKQNCYRRKDVVLAECEKEPNALYDDTYIKV